jgi:hypothetical protein
MTEPQETTPETTLEYQFLTEEVKNSIVAEQAKASDGPVNDPAVDDSLIAAWEADHFAHSQLAKNESDPNKKQTHLDAMATIEAAIKKARPSE